VNFYVQSGSTIEPVRWPGPSPGMDPWPAAQLLHEPSTW